MISNDGHMDSGELLDRMQWLQRVTRRLVSDPHLAEDLAQDALLAEWESRVEGRSFPRAWLGGVARNLHCMRLRTQARRRRRELESSPSEVSRESVPDAVGRLELIRELVEEMLQLDEPYRGAIVARYMEEKSPSEIAASTGVPLATVKTRLARGLRRLRERLDEQRPEKRGGWVGLWLATPAPAARGMGVAAMSAAAILIIGVSATVWHGLGKTPNVDSMPAETGVSMATLEEAVDGVEPLSLPPMPSRDLAVGLLPVGDTPAEKTTGKTTGGVEAREPERFVLVIDEGGAVRPGFRVRLTECAGGPVGEDSDLLVTSDDQGRVEVPQHVTAARVLCAEPGFVAIRSGWLELDGSIRDSELIVTRSRPVRGTVVDERGAVISGARISACLPGSVKPDTHSVPQRIHWAFTDHGGAFFMESYPELADAWVEVDADGYAPIQITPGSDPTLPLRVVMSDPTEREALRQIPVHGRVVDAEGRVRAGVEIRAILEGDIEALETIITDAGGFFRVRAPIADSFRLVATDVDRGVSKTLSLRAEEGPFLVHLPAVETVAISGRIVDVTGKGVAGAVLQISVPASPMPKIGEGALALRSGAQTITAADGSFRLARMPIEGAFLLVRAQDVMTPAFDLTKHLRSGETDGLTITVNRWRRFRISWDESVDGLELRDADGKVVRMYKTSRFLGGSDRLTSEATDVVWATDAAVDVIWLRRGEECSRTAFAASFTTDPTAVAILRP